MWKKGVKLVENSVEKWKFSTTFPLLGIDNYFLRIIMKIQTLYKILFWEDTKCTDFRLTN